MAVGRLPAGQVAGKEQGWHFGKVAQGKLHKALEKKELCYSGDFANAANTLAMWQTRRAKINRKKRFFTRIPTASRRE
jgi:hypothetical protein